MKNFWKTLSAAGAAAAPPWPPFSITAQTTILAFSDGPYPHHQDWSSGRGDVSPGSVTIFSAVPVLPEIETGNEPNTPDEVPIGACVASKRPVRTIESAVLSTPVGGRRRRA